MKVYSTAKMLKIIRPRRVADFRLHYRGQLYPQPSGIEIDPKNHVMQPYVGREINGFPVEVFHRRLLRFPLAYPFNVSTSRLSRLMTAIRPLAIRVCDGYSDYWDGNNMLGSYTEDADNAIDEIFRIVDSCLGDN